MVNRVICLPYSRPHKSCGNMIAYFTLDLGNFNKCLVKEGRKRREREKEREIDQIYLYKLFCTRASSSRLQVPSKQILVGCPDSEIVIPNTNKIRPGRDNGDDRNVLFNSNLCQMVIHFDQLQPRKVMWMPRN